MGATRESNCSDESLMDLPFGGAGATDWDAYVTVSPGARIIVHRIATHVLQSEAFASNFIHYLALLTGYGADASISRYARLEMRFGNECFFCRLHVISVGVLRAFGAALSRSVSFEFESQNRGGGALLSQPRRVNIGEYRGRH